jgi:hypothetical protein
MTYRIFRRRLSEATAAHDWLEGFAFVLGLGFLVLAALCVWGIVTAVVNIGDAESIPGTYAVAGFLEVTRGFAIVLFAVMGLVAIAVGWFFAGDTITRWARRTRTRG